MSRSRHGQRAQRAQPGSWARGLARAGRAARGLRDAFGAGARPRAASDVSPRPARGAGRPRRRRRALPAGDQRGVDLLRAARAGALDQPAAHGQHHELRRRAPRVAGERHHDAVHDVYVRRLRAPRPAHRWASRCRSPGSRRAISRSIRPRSSGTRRTRFSRPAVRPWATCGSTGGTSPGGARRATRPSASSSASAIPTGDGSSSNFGGDGAFSALPMVTGEWTPHHLPTFVANTRHRLPSRQLDQQPRR